MDITEISDRMELEKLVTDYATAVDSKNFNEFNNLFTKDAHIDYTAVGGIAGNLQEIITYLETALNHFPNYQHLISNISLDINNNKATGKVMCFNPMLMAIADGQKQMFFLGLWYVDEYRRTGSGWRISRRTEEKSWVFNTPDFMTL